MQWEAGTAVRGKCKAVTINVGASNFDNHLGAPNFDTLYLKRSSGLECRCIVKVKCIREAE